MPSSLAAGLQADYAIFDGNELVTVTSVYAGANVVTANVTATLIGPLSNREIVANQGLFQQGDLLWLIPDALLPAAAANKPKSGDKLQRANGEVWEFLQAERDELGLEWEIVTRKAR